MNFRIAADPQPAVDLNLSVDWTELFEYAPGSLVELRAFPGTLDTIAFYDTMTVPPVWLTHDPQPRYPHELRILVRQDDRVCTLNHRLPNPSQDLTAS